MQIIEDLALFSASAIMSWILVLMLMPLLRKQFMDIPNERSSHKLATPRGGGLAIVISGSIIHFCSAASPSRWVPIICLPLAVIGFIDDNRGLPTWLRYLVQMLTAAALISISSVSISSIQFIVLIIALTGIINFTNFMDGLDGLVAGCSVLMFAATSSWAISGAIFGFLLWNWSPARVFMGDVGSTFIGAVFGGLMLQQDSYSEIFLTLIMGLPLFADSTTCLLRRLMTNQNIFKPHKQHLFQRLNQAGVPHEKVALLYMSGVLLLLIANSVSGLPLVIVIGLIEMMVGLYLSSEVAEKFVKP